MGKNQHPEEMRPIPDGGLKEAMPGWLKRPPAWRNMPTAEQRHERALPEPDTSEIDPRTLVDIDDLPQWLQAIAARGDVPVPEPDETVEHAVEQVQDAASKAPDSDMAPEIELDELPATIVEAEEIVESEPERAANEPVNNLESVNEASEFSPLTRSLIVAGLIVVILLIFIFYML